MDFIASSKCLLDIRFYPWLTQQLYQDVVPSTTKLIESYCTIVTETIKKSSGPRKFVCLINKLHFYGNDFEFSFMDFFVEVD